MAAGLFFRRFNNVSLTEKHNQTPDVFCLLCFFRGHYSTMDGGDGTADLVINKRFVSEAELEERRKRRQEEWEKVRKPEDPKGMS